MVKDNIPASSQAVQTSDAESHDRPRVLLLGNGINYMTHNNQSWDNLTEDLEKPLTPFLEPTENLETTGELISKRCGMQLFRVQRAVNYQYGDKDAELHAVGKWAAKLDKVARNGLHALLARKKGLFQVILTTNYDHLVEKALGIGYSEFPSMPEASGNLFRRHTHEQTGVSVYHLHGEVGDTPGMLYSVSHYLEEITRIIRFTETHPSGTGSPSWLDFFINSELHICGLGFGFDELVLWYALQKRLERYGYGMLGAYVYLTYKPEEKDSVNARASVFQSYGVRPVLIEVQSDSNYEEAWDLLIGKMERNIARISKWKKEPRKNGASPAKFRGMNVTTSHAVATWNTERCQCNIRVAKLEKAATRGMNWYFAFEINKFQATYVIPAKELQVRLNELHCLSADSDQFRFLVDFRNGRIYAGSMDLPEIRPGMKRLSRESDFKPKKIK